MKILRSMIGRRTLMVAAVALVLSTFAGVAAAQSEPNTPADVSGRWTIYARNPDGSSDTKTMDIKQSGSELSGHFKGPNQSGGIEGSINGKHITIRTKTREIMRFWGQVDGDTIRGGFGIKGRHGEFEAKRTGK
jgi:hypothetical protein